MEETEEQKQFNRVVKKSRWRFKLFAQLTTTDI